MQPLSFGTKTLASPILVPSISSFETQLDPVGALRLQYSLREPVSLVSAYDVAKEKDQSFKDLCKEFQKSSVLLLDSGGYEHSHAMRYSHKNSPLWKFEDFKSVCDHGIYDCVFSYDYFWCDDNESETVMDFERKLEDEFFGKHDFIPEQKLIPVLHLQTRKGDKRFSEAEIVRLVGNLASKNKSSFLAVPERELGEGLIERFKLAKIISNTLADTNNNVGLHILGCGNLLSFAFFAVAGIRMADGLEWYRTFVADNFHLHHFQQEAVFAGGNLGVFNPTAELILGEHLPYRVKVATMNLMSLQAFSLELIPRLESRTVHGLVSKLFGEKAGSELRKLER